MNILTTVLNFFNDAKTKSGTVFYALAVVLLNELRKSISKGQAKDSWPLIVALLAMAGVEVFNRVTAKPPTTPQV